MTRKEFIQKAGGVYENANYYRSWSGRDKRENFWAFYDGEVIDENGNRLAPDEEIKSIYAGIEVGELLRKQKYSIEHIIPKSFLKDYLTSKNTASRIKRGATTNPFNFAPAHRNLNSERGVFPFDFEDDKIVRNFRISLEHSYTDYGLDAEMEWVVPTKTRGDIARAILYMSLVYGIAEYYGGHLDVLVRWAKQDVPTFWEIKFNQWVNRRLKINNPFVQDVDNNTPYSPLLDDAELLDSIKLNPNPPTDPSTENIEESGDSISLTVFTKGQLRIIAALVNPLGEDAGNETVSIMNTSTNAINLDGLTLRDKMNRRYIIGDLTINSGDVAKIRIDRSNFKLSNKEGEIQLITQSGEILDKVSYLRNDLPDKGNTIVF